MAADKPSYSLTEKNLEDIFVEVGQHGFNHRRFDAFVETGTFIGQTVIPLAHCFQEVHTIEIRRPCFLAARLASWKAKRPINFHLGPSLAVLPQLLPLLNASAVFFLDAHFSGGPTGGQELEVPLLRELRMIAKSFCHAALIIIDDLDLFGNVHTFDSCDEGWNFKGWCQTDWRNTDCETILAALQGREVACAFPVKHFNNFVIGLEPSANCPKRATRVGRAQDWAFDHEHWISAPSRGIDEAALCELKENSAGWAEMAKCLADEFYSSNKTERHRSRGARTVGGPRLQLQRVTMTKEQCEEMHDALILAYEAPAFQEELRKALAAAGSSKAKRIAAKQEVCWPIQCPIIEKYKFAPSREGLIECLSVARVYFENDENIQQKGNYLGWLVDPERQDGHTNS